MIPFPYNLLARLLAALALAGACWWGWEHYVVARYEAQGIAKIQPKLDECRAKLAAAETANATLAADLGKLKASLARSQASVAKLKAQENAARDARDAALAGALALEAELTAKIAALEALIATPSKTPEEACATADAVLRDLAGRRLRDGAAAH